MNYFLFGFLIWSCNVFAQEHYTYPETKKGSQTDTLWGQVVTDPYRWMENTQSPEVRDWIKAQEKIKEEFHGSAYRSVLEKMMQYSYIKFNPLFKEGKYFFYYQINDVAKAPVLYYRKSEYSDSIPLFNPNLLFDSDHMSIKGISISDNSKLLALSLAKNGSDWSTIRIMDMESHDLLKDQIQFVKYGSVYWYKNGVFYVRYDVSETEESMSGTIKGRKIYYHKIGTNQDEDLLVFSPKNEYSDFGFERTPEGKYLVLYYSTRVKSLSTHFVSLIALNDSLVFRPKTLILSKAKNTYFKVLGELNGKMLVKSNLSAPNGAIFQYTMSGTNQRDVLVEQYTQQLDNAKIIGHKLILVYNSEKQARAVIRDSLGKELKAWRIPEGSVFSEFSGDVNDQVAYYSFTSFIHPPSFYKIDLITFKNEPRGHSEITFKNNNLVTEKVYYFSKDSTRIPMYLTHQKDIILDGNNPTLLEGYGGFGISTKPYCSSANIVFMTSGGILASPCIRGGGDFPGWHEQGMRLNKQNTFDDFISAAEYLIASKYTNPKKLAAKGGSNGGLVVAACLVQRPDLFKVVVSESGVLDMLRLHLYNIGYTWKNEYGTIQDSLDFLNLLKYSPVNNVRQHVDYPATLLLASDNDDRVNPFQSFKFLAELQAKGAGSNPYVLYFQRKSGHSGSTIYEETKEADAYVYAFIFRQLGMKTKLN